MDASLDSKTILPKGVTRLRNGKYRFKRESKRYGLKLDRVDDSFTYIKRMADNFERTLQHYKKVDEDTKSKSSSFLDMKNIHKRGKQYFVEFMVNGELKTPMVTYDLHEALDARDKFRTNLLSEEYRKVKEKRDKQLQVKTQELREGLFELDYHKLKSALNFLELHEFLAATYDLDVERIINVH